MSRSRHVVIVGGGTAGWMAANLFVRRWPAEKVTVSLVESTTIGTVGVGEGSTPTLRRFFELIDVADSEWMPACQATYKVGIRFDGWGAEHAPKRYRHPFFSQPDVFVQRAFLTNCRTRRLGLDVNTQPDDFFLNGRLAQNRLAPRTPENFPFSVDYGYHFDAGLLGDFLAKLGIRRGVGHVDARIVDVIRDHRGDISALVSEDGKRIEGDFFIDCSGFASLLMQRTLGVDFLSFSENLFNDAAVAIPEPRSDEPACETVSAALSSGWRWQIPLQHRTGHGYVYSSAFISADEAETELRRVTGNLDREVEARHLKMRVGQCEKHWHRNCLALGLSQGFIEPLEATALLLVQVSVERFMDLYEAAGFCAEGQETFNREMRQRFEAVRDYIVAHYKLNGRTDSDYWRANRDNDAMSVALKSLLDLWYRSEALNDAFDRYYETSHFNLLSWHCLLAGYGAFPLLADKQPGRGDLYVDQRVADFVSGCALNFSPHGQALTQDGSRRIRGPQAMD